MTPLEMILQCLGEKVMRYVLTLKLSNQAPAKLQTVHLVRIPGTQVSVPFCY